MRKMIEQIEFSLMLHPCFIHSKGVIEIAKELNKKYHLEVDEDKITLAGLLHDVTKNYDEDSQLAILNKFYHNQIDDDLLLSPAIWHAITGRVIAEEQYHIIETDILNAIMYHTTGRPKMSHLELLIFLADFIERGRVGAHYEEVRKIAFEKGINHAIVKMYENEFEYIKRTNQHIYPLSIASYEYYKKEVEND